MCIGLLVKQLLSFAKLLIKFGLFYKSIIIFVFLLAILVSFYFKFDKYALLSIILFTGILSFLLIAGLHLMRELDIFLKKDKKEREEERYRGERKRNK